MAKKTDKVNFTATGGLVLGKTAIIVYSVGSGVRSVTSCLKGEYCNVGYSISGRSSIGLMIRAALGGCRGVSFLITGTNVNKGTGGPRRLSFRSCGGIVDIGRGNVFLFGGCMVDSVLRGNNNTVIGASSVFKMIKAGDTFTCSIDGKTVGGVAEDLTLACTGSGVEIGTITPNCISAPVLGSIPGRCGSMVTSDVPVKELNGSDRVTGLVYCLLDSRTSFVANSVMDVSNKFATTWGFTVCGLWFV